MIGISSGFAPYSGFGVRAAAPATLSGLSRPGMVHAQRASTPETPVQPVRAVPPVTVNASGNIDLVRRARIRLSWRSECAYNTPKSNTSPSISAKERIFYFTTLKDWEFDHSENGQNIV